MCKNQEIQISTKFPYIFFHPLPVMAVPHCRLLLATQESTRLPGASFSQAAEEKSIEVISKHTYHTDSQQTVIEEVGGIPNLPLHPMKKAGGKGHYRIHLLVCSSTEGRILLTYHCSVRRMAEYTPVRIVPV